MDVDVSDLIRQIETEAVRVRDAAAIRVLEKCREDCPVGKESPTRTTPPGTLRDSLEIDGVFDESPHFSFEITSPLDYAQFTDEVDTAPHPINAFYARALRFWWENGPDGARIYYYKRVWHPGTTGQRWFASKNQERFADALQEVT